MMRLRQPKMPTGVFVTTADGRDVEVTLTYVGRHKGMDEWRAELPAGFVGQVVAGGCGMLPGYAAISFPFGWHET